MKIGFDAKRAVQNNTGLGNYSRYVIEILSKYFPDNRYLLFAPKKKENPRLKVILSSKNLSFVYPSGVSKLFPSLWRVIGVVNDINKEKISIYHGLSNELPQRIKSAHSKSVVTIHDLIFLRYPEYYKPIDRTIYQYKFKRACQKADKIIAISESTKRDIISFFKIPEDKIEVIYQGCHPNFSIPSSEEKKQEIINKYNLPTRFLLSVGSIERRKNVKLIVKALKHLPESVHLVAVGKSTSYQQEVEEFAEKANLKSRLHIKNNVTFADLPVFYQLSVAFIYPSFFEGFGIPIIEALSSGTPVIAARGSCLEEAGGPASLYTDPKNDIELANHINEVLHNPKLAQDMIENGYEYVKRFSDEQIASDIMKVYQSLY